jgi:hypothetical protein
LISCRLIEEKSIDFQSLRKLCNFLKGNKKSSPRGLSLPGGLLCPHTLKLKDCLEACPSAEKRDFNSLGEFS